MYFALRTDYTSFPWFITYIYIYLKDFNGYICNRNNTQKKRWNNEICTIDLLFEKEFDNMARISKTNNKKQSKETAS